MHGNRRGFAFCVHHGVEFRFGGLATAGTFFVVFLPPKHDAPSTRRRVNKVLPKYGQGMPFCPLRIHHRETKQNHVTGPPPRLPKWGVGARKTHA
jgi:hypothetical protein